MTPLAETSGLGPEFDDFLFAVIGDDRNGMPLSVVSVLARVDLDPWHEAATLAAMPGELAARRLAPLLATLSEAHFAAGERRDYSCSSDCAVAASDESQDPPQSYENRAPLRQPIPGLSWVPS
jgi:hypothetical protein